MSKTEFTTSFDLKDDMKPEISLVEDASLPIQQFDEDDPDSIEETEPGWYLYIVSLAIALGGVLFGYDTGVISGVLVVIRDDLDNRTLSTGEKELITSIVAAGAFTGGIIAGLLVDKIGRRLPLILASFLFTIGAIIQASAFGIAQMTVGRFIVGLGVGLAAMIVPVYVAELAPSKYRGRMMSLNSVCINSNQAFACIIDFAFEHVKGGWRYMVGGAAIPSILLGIAVYCVPDSPRFLIQVGKIDQATAVIKKIYPHATEKQVANKVISLEAAFHSEHTNYTLMQRLKILYGDKTNFKALTIGCGLMAIQQLAGTNCMTYYAPTLFALVGFTEAIAVSIVVSGTNAIFSSMSFLTVDRVGRRRLLISTSWLMSLFLVIGAIAISYIPIRSDLTVEDAKLSWAGILVLVSIICYIASFAIGIGNIAWMGSELLPMEVRSLSSTMINCTCWAFNAVVGSTYLSMMKTFTPSGAFGFYAGTTFFGWLASVFLYPEVTDLTLEEIKEVFNHGFGVRYTSKLRKERKLKEKAEKENSIDSGDNDLSTA